MLYRFQSRETADVLMFQKDAERVLTILGKNPAAPGVITWQDIPDAITLLKAEAERERVAIAASATPHTLEEPFSEEKEPAMPTTVSVQLHQRIAPLVKAMERCHAARKDLIWII